MSANLLTKAGYCIGLTLWVLFAIILGQALAAFIVINLRIDANEAVLATVLAAFSYLLGLAIVIGLPWLATRRRIDTKTLGISRFPRLSDVGLGVVGIAPYYIISGVLLWVGMALFQAINPEVGQQIAFENLTLKFEYIVAFITLVILAPVAEELLFRGYFLGKMSQKINRWLAVIITALAFGLLHVPAFGETGFVLQWAAGVDTFAMGLVAGSLRITTGSIWAGVLLHAFKNAIAYYFLFINPLPLGGM